MQISLISDYSDLNRYNRIKNEIKFIGNYVCKVYLSIKQLRKSVSIIM